MHNLLTIRKQLDRIEKKLESKYSDPFLNIKQVADYTTLSASTIRRAIRKGYLKCLLEERYRIKVKNWCLKCILKERYPIKTE